ncbi:MAG: hypothetical protein HYZ45_12005 [Burkholderiales bacterium]|nr:hypothetical protein [Burkholderiales bacterium]
MTDELKNIYKQHGKLQYYFDEKVPCDLFRGQSRSEEKKGFPIIYPNPGFTNKDGKIRPADVKIVERDGKQFVLGCRSISGHYRGISVFDKPNPALLNFSWYKLPAGTAIPEALAITQDGNDKFKPNHYTIAPKDDMPVELFLIWLNALIKCLEPV